AGNSAVFEIAMCRRGVAERVARADGDLENAATDEVEQFIARGLIVLPLGDKMAEARPRHRERAFLAQENEIERRHMSRRVAVIDQHAERPHAIERGDERVLADAV